ncbi:MAG: hypothetical protein AB3N13_03490 [Arenibacterium sp.]
MTHAIHKPKITLRARRAMWALFWAGCAVVVSLVANGTALQAQTPIPTTVANLIRYCLFSPDGLRGPETAYDMRLAVQHLANHSSRAFVPVAPGLYRISQANPPLTVEMKLRDANGAAHCLVYGPALTPGMGPPSADKFVELFYRNATLSVPSGTVTRRYTFAGLPYQMELVAYAAQSVGEIVGLTFTDIPANLRTTEMADAGTASATEIQGVMGNAAMACAQNIGYGANLRGALEAAGLRYDRPIGTSGRSHVYFGAQNTVQVTAGPGTCRIQSRAVQAGTAVQLVQNYLNARLPGRFVTTAPDRYTCGGFRNVSSNSGPLILQITNIDNPSAYCSPVGPAQINFVVPG